MRILERTRALEHARQETLFRLALAGEFRDDQTREHAQRVGRTAALLAAELTLADEEVQSIDRAAPLHDIGKLAVPDAILLKPGRLAGDECEVIPLSGRLVAVADTFDALTHERPYRRAWSLEPAVDEVRGVAGSQLDPDVVQAFNRLDHRMLLGPIQICKDADEL